MEATEDHPTLDSSLLQPYNQIKKIPSCNKKDAMDDYDCDNDEEEDEEDAGSGAHTLSFASATHDSRLLILEEEEDDNDGDDSTIPTISGEDDVIPTVISVIHPVALRIVVLTGSRNAVVLLRGGGGKANKDDDMEEEEEDTDLDHKNGVSSIIKVRSRWQPEEEDEEKQQQKQLSQVLLEGIATQKEPDPFFLEDLASTVAALVHQHTPTTKALQLQQQHQQHKQQQLQQQQLQQQQQQQQQQQVVQAIEAHESCLEALAATVSDLMCRQDNTHQQEVIFDAVMGACWESSRKIKTQIIQTQNRTAPPLF
jgi:hypothetical protein